MAETTPKHYLYGVIIATMFLIGFISMMSTLDSAQGNKISGDPVFSEFNHSFNRFGQLNSSVTGLQTSITEAQTEQGVFGVLNALINTAWNTLKQLFSTFNFVGEIFHNLSSIFGVPTWVGTGISLLIIVMIAFTIWSAIFQTKL